eukprot:CAMPEP_0204589088 /NCGR_PEP_ID=MMETSP0661-20131031/48997_1 /ASSEMBLY_ACC=CAM_ASM_000606 /TAXON_ID=109239 /ORGANISM="Alexandrium margalefi, Strain AMGDE01CS-322" /LENGTH=394 /DNA_ID=CAMNT_0051598973 /DNA_START=47 /DNA_END=1228 /DNA_ORIENTATION=+
MAVAAPRLTPEALAFAAGAALNARRARVPEEDETKSEDSDSGISSVASMGRQITEVSQAQCMDLMEQQCRGFQARESDFWKRQSTTPAERRNTDCLDGLRRQISCPMPSKAPVDAPQRLARIQDSSSYCSSMSPRASPVGSRQVSQSAEAAPEEGLLENTICSVVSDCNFSVACADPSSMDMELIAVSEGFVNLTGYSREEALGENCRFLNEGCSMPEEQRSQLSRSVETGSPFVGVVRNRKKSGDTFLNLLDLRGLVIARNTRSAEDIWVIIAVQQDITNMDRSRLPANHLPLLNQVAGRIRKRLVKQLAELGLAGAMTEIPWPKGAPSSSSSSKASISRPTGSWCLASSTCWKSAEQPAIHRAPEAPPTLTSSDTGPAAAAAAPRPQAPTEP